jgi:hypothetical protein
MLYGVYPEYEWLPWKFSHTPTGIWKGEDVKRRFLDWAGKKLGIKEFDDWSKVSKQVTIYFIQNLTFLRTLKSWDVLYTYRNYW